MEDADSDLDMNIAALSIQLSTVMKLNAKSISEVSTQLSTIRETILQLSNSVQALQDQVNKNERELKFPKFAFANGHESASIFRSEGYTCLHIAEAGIFFSDNYLCQFGKDVMLGWIWSVGGPRSGMECINLYEAGNHWEDNYLCKPYNEKYEYHYRWSRSGSIPGMNCVRFWEPQIESWNDNYFCVSLQEPGSEYVYKFVHY